MKKLKRPLFISLIAAITISLASCSSHRHSVKRDKTSTTQLKSDEKTLKEIERKLKGDEKKIMDEAMEWLGTPYTYGRQDKGVATDCSGFVMMVFDKSIGCKLPRNSAKQSEFCDKVSANKVKPGDLVFFITNNGNKINHVGIMIDDVQFIHASTKGVRINSLEQNFYKTRVQKFGRVPCMKH